MTTRADLRNLVRRRLGDLTAPYTQSDLQVNQWINDAIADYSVYFPQVKTASITAVTGTHEYSLPVDFVSIVRVEWPVGREPEEFLERVNRAESAGPYTSGVYEMMESHSSAVSKIWFADEMMTGSNPEIVYQASQDSLDDDGDVTTVPDRHLDLLVLFCRWASLQELASEEAANPDPSQLNVSVLDTNAGRAERSYRKSLSDFLQAEKSSQRVSWRMERDRIY